MGKGRVVRVSGIAKQGRTATILMRGSNKMVLEEADRSVHDALCVIRCLVQKRFLIAGGAAPEVEVTRQLSAWAKTLLVSWDAAARWVACTVRGGPAVAPTTTSNSCTALACKSPVDVDVLVLTQ